MIKTKRKLNKAMLIANVIPFVSTAHKTLAFHSILHDDFLAVPAPTVAIGWRDYGYMVNQAGMGGRWPRTDYLTDSAGYKRVKV